MRGPRNSKEMRLFKDMNEEELYQGAIDEVDQRDKWKAEAVERAKPRPEPNLNEFMKAFDMLPKEAVSYKRDDPTSAQLSPVLLGHEERRKRHANLLKELEEAEPEMPPKVALPPPVWSES